MGKLKVVCFGLIRKLPEKDWSFLPMLNYKYRWFLYATCILISIKKLKKKNKKSVIRKRKGSWTFGNLLGNHFTQGLVLEESVSQPCVHYLLPSNHHHRFNSTQHVRAHMKFCLVPATFPVIITGPALSPPRYYSFLSGHCSYSVWSSIGVHGIFPMSYFEVRI